MATPPSGDDRRHNTAGPIGGQQQISAAVIEGLEDALALVDSDSDERVTVGAGRPPAAADGRREPS